jgi:hypothetical protein
MNTHGSRFQSLRFGSLVGLLLLLLLLLPLMAGGALGLAPLGLAHAGGDSG